MRCGCGVAAVRLRRRCIFYTRRSVRRSGGTHATRMCTRCVRAPDARCCTISWWELVVGSARAAARAHPYLKTYREAGSRYSAVISCDEIAPPPQLDAVSICDLDVISMLDLDARSRCGVDVWSRCSLDVVWVGSRCDLDVISMGSWWALDVISV